MRVLILGGTGVISREIVKQLLAENHEVVLYNRGSRKLPFAGKVEQIIGDRSNQEEFEGEMKRHKFDAVIDMICFNEEDAKSTLRALGGKVEQIIVTSSIAAYKRPYHTLPIMEDAEELWDDPIFGYAFHKAEMERYLQKAVQERNLPVTIIRPSLTYGIGGANVGVFRQNFGIIDRIRKGKPLVMFGDGTTPWNFTFTPDVAKAYVGVLGNKKAYGQSYHVTNETNHIWEDLYLEFGRLIGKKPEIVHISSELLYKAVPDLFAHLYFEKSYAGLFDNSKLKRDVPGFKADISLQDGLQLLLDWYEKEAYTVDPEKDALEDKVIEIYNGWEKQMADFAIL